MYKSKINGGDEMGKILNKKQMTEEDIKLHYITPSIMRRCENVTTDILLRIRIYEALK